MGEPGPAQRAEAEHKADPRPTPCIAAGSHRARGRNPRAVIMGGREPGVRQRAVSCTIVGAALIDWTQARHLGYMDRRRRTRAMFMRGGDYDRPSLPPPSRANPFAGRRLRRIVPGAPPRFFPRHRRSPMGRANLRDDWLWFREVGFESVYFWQSLSSLARRCSWDSRVCLRVLISEFQVGRVPDRRTSSRPSSNQKGARISLDLTVP
jgi:hypothetical protein